MGNDGGSIPRRREVVKQKKKEQHKESYEIAKAKSSLCALGKDQLTEPLAFCKLGLLYNKEEVIKRLIEKNMPKAFRHIRKLKDVKDIKANFKIQADGTKVIVCPVSQHELNGFHPFMAVWGCGCVFSEDAFKELKVCDTCINCGAKIEKKSDIISLNQPVGLQEAYLRIFDEARANEVKNKQEIIQIQTKPMDSSKPD